MYDVIIVGAGAAGLSLAHDLMAQNARVSIIEKAPLDVLTQPSDDGRHIALTHKTLTILRQMGVLDVIDARHIHPIFGAWVQKGNAHTQKPTTTRFYPPKGKDSLGSFIAHHRLKSALFAINRAPIISASIQTINTKQDGITIHTDQGELHTRLIVAADGRLSGTRAMLGIGASTHDFGQSIFLARVRHSQSHYKITTERFCDDDNIKSVAVLPLDGIDTSGVVMTAHRVHDLMTASDDDLARVLSDFCPQLGQITHIDTRHRYPLMASLAHRVHGAHAAIIGDAALGLHPVTAHGFNMSIHGARLLAKYHAIDPKAAPKRYARAYYPKAVALYHASNLLVSALTPDHALAHASVLLGRFLPINHAITKLLTG